MAKANNNEDALSFLQVDDSVEHPDKLHLASWCGDEKEVRNMINKAGNEKYYNVIYMYLHCFTSYALKNIYAIWKVCSHQKVEKSIRINSACKKCL